MVGFPIKQVLVLEQKKGRFISFMTQLGTLAMRFKTMHCKQPLALRNQAGVLIHKGTENKTVIHKLGETSPQNANKAADKNNQHNKHKKKGSDSDNNSHKDNDDDDKNKTTFLSSAFTPTPSQRQKET